MGTMKRQLKDGIKWRYQGYYKGTRYTGPAIYSTQKEAEEAEKVYLASLKGDSLQALMQDYIKHLRINTTNAGYQKHSERVIQRLIDYMKLPAFPVKDVTRRHIEDFKQNQALKAKEAEHSPHSVNSELRILKAFFNYCISVKEIEMSNPVANVKHLALDDESKYIPTDADLITLRKELDKEETLLVDFCAETGCRINEALRLTSRDVDKETVTLKTRKAKNSNLTSRVIPRPHCLKDDHLPSNGDRVFKRWSAQPRFLEKTVRELMEKVEEFSDKPLLSDYFNWHNLRHKAASEWAHGGMALIEIMARLGHNNIETTQNYLQSLGFTTVKYTKNGKPEYQAHPNRDDIEADSVNDVKLYEYLSEKIGKELAREIVIEGGTKDTERKLKESGITKDLVRDYITNFYVPDFLKKHGHS